MANQVDPNSDADRQAQAKDPSPAWVDDEVASLLEQAEALTETLAAEFDGDIPIAPTDSATPAPADLPPERTTEAEPFEAVTPPPVPGTPPASLAGSSSRAPAPWPAPAAPPPPRPRRAAHPPLGDLLNDPDADDAAVDAAPRDDNTLVVENQTVEAALSHAEAEAEPAAVTYVIAEEPDQDASAATDVGVDSSAHEPNMVDDERAPDDRPAPPGDEDAAVSTAQPPPAIARNLGSLLHAFVRRSLIVFRATATAPRMMAALGVRLLIVLDAPFARISSGTRRVIGVVALASLICAVLAWTLPWLILSNPFESMPTGTLSESAMRAARN